MARIFGQCYSKLYGSIGLGIVALKKQPVLIIVHRKQLFDQWVERIQSFLGIARAPFSFLFLLEGEKKYHIVWETLNSEEATYVWHFEKSMDALRKGLTEIEIILNEIKATSKMDYLRKEYDNFSRVVHDYTDAKSGFTFWKGMLEEKLT